jgi:hypothetical protein
MGSFDRPGDSVRTCVYFVFFPTEKTAVRKYVHVGVYYGVYLLFTMLT